jgi:2-oxoglutarate dehydrogenase E1 component
MQTLDEMDDRPPVAVTRVEQFYPFPKEAVRAEMERFSDAGSIVWLQEEPENMGAWRYIRSLLQDEARDVRDSEIRIEYAGRKASASPATGSSRVHKAEQDRLLRQALALEMEPA